MVATLFVLSVGLHSYIMLNWLGFGEYSKQNRFYPSSGLKYLVDDQRQGIKTLLDIGGSVINRV